MYKKLAYFPRKVKILIMMMSDVILLPLALYSAVALRLGTFTPDISKMYWVFIILPFISVPIFLRMGLYRAVIRYMDDKILITVLYCVSLSVLLLMASVVMFHAEGLPRSSIIIYWITAVAYIALSRYLARGVLRTLEHRSDRREKVAIYGAGKSGLQTALSLHSSTEYLPIAFFDDNKDLQGTVVAGIRVYSPDNALEIMMGYDCNQLLIAMPSATRARRKEIIQQFENTGLVLKTLPGIGELVDGRVRVEQIREVGVEDLLGRDPVPPIPELFESCITNKIVLVTGAGGSIGSELCIQIASQKPKALILFENNEYALFQILERLKSFFPQLIYIPILGDILNAAHVSKVLSQYQVETLYHAAAFKHVPLVESNVIAGVKNNTFGTKTVAEMCIQNKVKDFVLISSDKAVRPTNVMGATKRLSELVLQSLASEPGVTTKFTMVRFGNVLGSSGSVVPFFKEQISRGGPVTVTHPEVTRFFMTIPEAAQLVIQAGSMGVGGDVFVLDMGEPVKIVDLAKKMIRLSGLEYKNPETGEGDIAIEFVGLRPGEKLYEELLIGDKVEKTNHPRILKAFEKKLEKNYLYSKLEEMHEACLGAEVDRVKQLLHELVEEYKIRD